ncbi:serine-rich adhesin for platelets isoform X5 [Clupea harengus]|uniref:Serine-rich adhesin for platelets isoform X5 n=1 Tax=Clupea harengus TaxID=7950 RepID=A0A6P8FUQ7_CLUHA|nr:serine-rich adhesin for platelets isoform X5 [Clupea harengus]
MLTSTSDSFSTFTSAHMSIFTSDVTGTPSTIENPSTAETITASSETNPVSLPTSSPTSEPEINSTSNLVSTPSTDLMPTFDSRSTSAPTTPTSNSTTNLVTESSPVSNTMFPSLTNSTPESISTSNPPTNPTAAIDTDITSTIEASSTDNPVVSTMFPSVALSSSSAIDDTTNPTTVETHNPETTLTSHTTNSGFTSSNVVTTNADTTANTVTPNLGSTPGGTSILTSGSSSTELSTSSSHFSTSMATSSNTSPMQSVAVTSAATSQTTEESESTTTEVLPPVQGTTTSSATSSASTTTEASSPSTTTVQPPAETSTMTTVETTANTNTVMQSTQSTTMVEPTMTVQSTASTSTVEVESTASMTTAVQSSTSTTMVTQSSMNGTTPETRPTTPSIDPCTLCPRGSTCVNSTCQCLPGTYLVPGNPPECDDARVFPGDLRLNRTFQPEMADQSSQQFRDTAGSIIRSLNIALRDVPGYINSTVTQLRQGSVIAAVQNIFQTNLEATENSTTAAIQQAITSCTGECGTVLSRATFNSVPLCDLNPGPCSAETTECGAQGGRPSCTCKGGFVSNAYSRHTCIACPSGQRAVGDECVWCAFGYSGFNCNDSSLLAVVVISCVLGGLLLILILALIIYYCITCRRNKQQKDCHSPYTPDDFRRSSWTTQGITPIPRATINPNASLETSLEMTEGGSTHSLVSKRGNTNGLKMGRKTGSYDVTTNDNLGTFKGKNPSRYSYLVQGHENPYFIPGDENKST